MFINNMEKKFDAVKMVREIRDKLYEETKDMSDEERIEYFKREGERAEKKLRDRAKRRVKG